MKSAGGSSRWVVSDVRWITDAWFTFDSFNIYNTQRIILNVVVDCHVVSQPRAVFNHPVPLRIYCYFRVENANLLPHRKVQNPTASANVQYRIIKQDVRICPCTAANTRLERPRIVLCTILNIYDLSEITKLKRMHKFYRWRCHQNS